MATNIGIMTRFALAFFISVCFAMPSFLVLLSLSTLVFQLLKNDSAARLLSLHKGGCKKGQKTHIPSYLLRWSFDLKEIKYNVDNWGLNCKYLHRKSSLIESSYEKKLHIIVQSPLFVPSEDFMKSELKGLLSSHRQSSFILLDFNWIAITDNDKDGEAIHWDPNILKQGSTHISNVQKLWIKFMDVIYSSLKEREKVEFIFLDKISSIIPMACADEWMYRKTGGNVLERRNVTNFKILRQEAENTGFFDSCFSLSSYFSLKLEIVKEINTDDGAGSSSTSFSYNPGILVRKIYELFRWANISMLLSSLSCLLFINDSLQSIRVPFFHVFLDAMKQFYSKLLGFHSSGKFGTACFTPSSHSIMWMLSILMSHQYKCSNDDQTTSTDVDGDKCQASKLSAKSIIDDQIKVIHKTVHLLLYTVERRLFRLQYSFLHAFRDSFSIQKINYQYDGLCEIIKYSHPSTKSIKFNL